MKALIVINPFSTYRPMLDKASRLQAECQKRGVTAVIRDTLSFHLTIQEDLSLSLDDVSDMDFCIFMDKDKYLGVALSRIMPVFNSPESIAVTDDKTTTYLHAAGVNVKVPTTIPAPFCYTVPSQEKTKEFLDDVERKLGYPMVAKNAYGSLGKEVYLIQNRKELEERFRSLANVTHLYQAFVGNDIHAGKDYRVIVIGGKFFCAMERINAHDFRSNIGMGAIGKAVDPVPLALIQAGEAIAKALGLDYAGIDLYLDKLGQAWFYEANSNAFFEEAEKATGKNIAGAFVDYCLAKAAKSQL